MPSAQLLVEISEILQTNLANFPPADDPTTWEIKEVLGAWHGPYV